MLQVVISPITVVIGLAAGVSAWAQAGSHLDLATARFRDPGAGAGTRLYVFWRVAGGTLQAADSGAPRAGYRITLAVQDSVGNELERRSWAQIEPDGVASRTGAGWSEHAWLTLTSGRFRLTLTVTEPASGRTLAREETVESLAPEAPASDLVLARSSRDAGPGDTLDGAGQLRVGQVVLAGASWPELPRGRATLAYYAELYRAIGVSAETAVVSVQALDRAGRPRLHAPVRAIGLAAPAGVVRGVLNLARLPPGPYRLVLTARIGTDSVLRSAPFTIEDSGDPFDVATEARLDSLYGPLIYVMEQEERGVYSALPTEGKRDYLRRFWARRDPTPGTPKNEVRDSFYTNVGRTNRAFREGGAAQIPGWRTDRGRIYLKNGPPDEVLSRPQPGGTMPYEVWKYTRGKLRKYVFLDLTRFGNYMLIYTNDLGEISRPDWQRLLGREAWEDVVRF